MKAYGPCETEQLSTINNVNTEIKKLKTFFNSNQIEYIAHKLTRHKSQVVIRG